MTIPWLRRGAKVTAVFALPGDRCGGASQEFWENHEDSEDKW